MIEKKEKINIVNVGCTIILAIATVVSVVMSWYTVRISKKSLEQERKSKRPYFVLTEDSGIKESKFGSLYKELISVKNIGLHPARDVAFRVIHIGITPENKLSFLGIDDISLSDEIPYLGVSVQVREIGDVRVMVGSQYIIILVKYMDAFESDRHSQRFYYKWGGDPKGKGYVIYNFEQILSEERKKIDDSFGQEYIDKFLNPVENGKGINRLKN